MTKFHIALTALITFIITLAIKESPTRHYEDDQDYLVKNHIIKG